MEKEVITIIAEFLELDPSEVKVESKLKEDLNADSLDFAELLMELEEKFEFEADEKELGDIQTVGDIIVYIQNVKK